MTIYLIGTVHTDPQIVSRLETSLDLIKPQTIFVEGCAEMQPLIDGVRSKVEQGLEEAVGCKWSEATKKKIKNSIVGPMPISEFSAVREYASKRGICWYGLDKSKPMELVCAEALSLMPEFCYVMSKLSEKDVKEALAKAQKNDSLDFDAAYHQFDDPDFKRLLSIIPFEMLGARDKQWEKIIRKCYQKTPDANLAVVCGDGHLIELGNRTIYDRLKDLQAKRAPLPDAVKGKYR